MSALQKKKKNSIQQQSNVKCAVTSHIWSANKGFDEDFALLEYDFTETRASEEPAASNSRVKTVQALPIPLRPQNISLNCKYFN